MTHAIPHRLLARALSRPVFTALARGERPRHVFKFLGAASLSGSGRVRDVFEEAFDVLRTSYRNEYVYKAAIADRIIFGRHSPRTSSFHVEMPVGKSIVDVAVFNGTSTAYEVKTEFDSSRRLSTQTPDYLRAFDRVFVVTHPALAERYATTCAAEVGVLALDHNERLTVVRNATSNLARICPRIVFRMLRKDEYVGALEAISSSVIDLPNGRIASYCESLFSRLPPQQVHEVLLDSMRKRTTVPKVWEFVANLPSCLRVLGYASNLSSPQQETFLRVLESPVS